MKRDKLIPMNLNDPVQLPRDKWIIYDKMQKAYYKSYAQIFPQVLR